MLPAMRRRQLITGETPFLYGRLRLLHTLVLARPASKNFEVPFRLVSALPDDNASLIHDIGITEFMTRRWTTGWTSTQDRGSIVSSDRWGTRPGVLRCDRSFCAIVQLPPSNARSFRDRPDRWPCQRRQLGRFDGDAPVDRRDRGRPIRVPHPSLPRRGGSDLSDIDCRRETISLSCRWHDIVEIA
jgi:hypothetical protein